MWDFSVLTHVFSKTEDANKIASHRSLMSPRKKITIGTFNIICYVVILLPSLVKILVHVLLNLCLWIYHMLGSVFLNIMSYYRVVSHDYVLMSNIYQGWSMWWTSAPKNHLRYESARDAKVYAAYCLWRLNVIFKNILFFGPRWIWKLYHIWHQMHFLSHISHTCHSKLCNVMYNPTASYPHVYDNFSTNSQTWYSLCVFLWMGFYVYVLKNKYCCLLVGLMI